LLSKISFVVDFYYYISRNLSGFLQMLLPY